MDNVPKTARPALLSTGMVLSGITGATFLLCLLLAPFDIGTYTINDETVSGPEFLRGLGILLVAYGGLLLFISYTLARHDPDSRPLMIAFWLAVGVMSSVFPLIRPDEADFDVTWLFALAVAVWYLYFKRNVAAYYSDLKTQSAATASAGADRPAQ